MKNKNKKAPTRIGSVVLFHKAEKRPDVNALAEQHAMLRIEFARVTRQRLDARQQLIELESQCAALDLKHTAIQSALDLADKLIANSLGEA